MFIGETLKKLKKNDLVEFICMYNDYVQNFYDEHDKGSYPCCIAEFYDNERQINFADFILDKEIKKRKETDKLLSEVN